MEIKPNWKITSEFWITCSNCDFAILMPLVAMVGNIGFWNKIFKKSPEEKIVSFMCNVSKYCKKCKITYISKNELESIKLKDKYWEEFISDGDAEFVFYLEENTIAFDVCSEDKCLCQEPLELVSDKCPLCKNRLKCSQNEINGLPITRARQMMLNA